MMGVKFYVKYDQQVNESNYTEIRTRIQKWLGNAYGGIEYIVISADEKPPKIVNGIKKVEIPVTITNIHRVQVTRQLLERSLEHLFDGFSESNLQIEIAE